MSSSDSESEDLEIPFQDYLLEQAVRCQQPQGQHLSIPGSRIAQPACALSYSQEQYLLFSSSPAQGHAARACGACAAKAATELTFLLIAVKTETDFKIDGVNGRCRICPPPRKGHGWMKLGNLRAHEGSKPHQEVVARRIQYPAERGDIQAQQTNLPIQHTAPWLPGVTVEDCEDDFNNFNDFWYHRPQETLADADVNHIPHTSHSGRTGASTDGKHLSAAMRDALTGDDFIDSTAATVTLEDVLSGAGLFEAVSSASTDWLEEEPLAGSVHGLYESETSAGGMGLQHHPDNIAQDVLGARMSLSGSDYYPYLDKGMMKTDILFSSPELRFSRTQQEAILAWGTDLGARNVPSLYKLDKYQKEALDACGNLTTRVQSSSENIFYHNAIGHAITKDYAHPDIRPLIRAYPLFSSGRVSETSQASKWLVEAPDHLLTPMLTCCRNDRWFIPTRFFELEGQGMWAVGHQVHASQDGFQVDTECKMMACSDFVHNWPDVEEWKNVSGKASDLFAHVFPFHSSALNNIPMFLAAYSKHNAAIMPHPDRLTAGGLEWECPPLIIFIDDVSGNSSKQWNVHYSCYMSNSALPQRELEKSRNVKFFATSPHASPMEIIQAVCEDIRRHGCTNPIRAWDAVWKRYVLVRPWLLFLPGDNPMQAELCSYIGLKGNYFCPCCHVRGDKVYKKSDAGFVPLLNAITMSGTKDTLAMPTINRLLALGKAFRRATPERKALTPEEVNRELHKELLKRRDDSITNPLLKMDGLDVHQDTPIETLYTHLLSVVKYFWAQTVWVLKKKGQLQEFQTRLGSLAKSCLKIPNIMADYICRYRGALIGKHFKTLSQVMSFAICGLVEQQLQNAWLAIGDLTVLLWETEIGNIEIYADTLRKAIDDVVNFAAALSPSLLMEKNKFHILTHLPDHEHCRHMATGGYWFDTASGQWTNPLDARLLSVPITQSVTPGKMQLASAPPEPQAGAAMHRRPAGPPPLPWSKMVSASLDADLRPPLHRDGILMVLKLEVAVRKTLNIYTENRPVYFDNRPELHRLAAVSLCDTKLQKKLAKEACICRIAEDAPQQVNQPGMIDLLGLQETPISAAAADTNGDMCTTAEDSMLVGSSMQEGEDLPAFGSTDTILQRTVSAISMQTMQPKAPMLPPAGAIPSTSATAYQGDAGDTWAGVDVGQGRQGRGRSRAWGQGRQRGRGVRGGQGNCGGLSESGRAPPGPMVGDPRMLQPNNPAASYPEEVSDPAQSERQDDEGMAPTPPGMSGVHDPSTVDVQHDGRPQGEAITLADAQAAELGTQDSEAWEVAHKLTLPFLLSAMATQPPAMDILSHMFNLGNTVNMDIEAQQTNADIPLGQPRGNGNWMSESVNPVMDQVDSPASWDIDHSQTVGHSTSKHGRDEDVDEESFRPCQQQRSSVRQLASLGSSWMLSLHSAAYIQPILSSGQASMLAAVRLRAITMAYVKLCEV
ncbi:hypothetical protein BV20DRAFT_984071 [Pilatotrama ljubarskyi]|nr:hypothetical protein BV20DRAFT_984071 [Pilatotrama ljubarskyi]